MGLGGCSAALAMTVTDSGIRNGSLGLLRFARNDSPRCGIRDGRLNGICKTDGHCEERSDEAISGRL
jgi:hypothetical protein